ncbi:PREDICTED: uncharacterized protein LOC104601611 [Nelumbo nucifera]|uniref:Protein HAPLESS 2-like n=2 Tax=Nelumbo nucifera TaxID=4432 RepID=A0A822ZTG8_NELNU|nr:PREDICTED: uncharacterized protein LOC104601611 [Nelumbo nucifera]DAD46186.1 TPA_asm: hypothetical protein HUJ06_004416 [Nelumbo nucifera]
MGTVISKTATGIGGILGNAFVAPIKTVFGGSCEGICLGTWDIICFIEHFCVSNLVKLLMVLGLAYISIMFIYLLFKIGIIQCVGRSLCKMRWAACEAYWRALQHITCFLWHKLKNTKRVHRCRHFQDIEEGCGSTDDGDCSETYGSLSTKRKWKSIKGRRKDQMQMSFYPVRQGLRDGYRSHSHHHNVRLKASVVSVRVKGESTRACNSRHIQVSKPGNLRKAMRLYKRRRIS